MQGLGLVFGYDAFTGNRLAGPVASAFMPRRVGLLGALKRKVQGGNVCGPGCWPISTGGCDCDNVQMRGAAAPIVSPQAVTTLAVLAALAVGVTIYGKLHARGR